MNSELDAETFGRRKNKLIIVFFETLVFWLVDLVRKIYGNLEIFMRASLQVFVVL